MPIEGRGRYLFGPQQIPSRDRDIHLVELKICSDMNRQHTLGEEYNQHLPLIQGAYEHVFPVFPGAYKLQKRASEAHKRASGD